MKGNRIDMKRIIALLSGFMLIVTLTACSGDTVASTDIVFASQATQEFAEESSAAVDPQQNSETTPSPISVEYDRDDLDSSASSSDMVYVTLEGDSITVDGSGAAVNGSVVTITSAGMYHISGVLDDGQIIVETADEEKVMLILDGANVACSTSAPIYVVNSEKTVITLADGAENYVTDGDVYVFEDAASDEPNAAIFSHDDLTINGNGSLTVNANYNNGIASKDDLKITGGNITVNAVNDGIKGRDSIAVRDGTITVNAGGDGMQTTNDEEAEKGYISIEGGALDITAGTDGIQAQTSLSISGGSITIISGGGSVNTGAGGEGIWGGQGMGGNPNKPTVSAKGLKAGVDITITAGTIHINSADDSIHSNDRITIDGGEILLASGDDGVRADSTLTITGGNLRITESYEGIESAVITINGGTIQIVASDDGINAAGGGSAMTGWQGQNPFEWSGDYKLYVNGGYIAIDALGDGLDINGPIDMTGGTVIINGPTGNNNGALDYAGAFNITGGFLVAVGSSGMAQAPSASSTQYSVIHNFQSPQAAGTMVHIESADGEDILTFTPTKTYQSIVLSSSDLKNGATYVVYVGGSATGTVSDGLYSGGAYSGGSQVTSFTIAGIVTGAGAYGGLPAGPGGGRWGGGGGGGRMQPPGSGRP
jgi:hypothetical protein